MYNLLKKIIKVAVLILCSLFFTAVIFTMVPQFPWWGGALTATILFIVVSIVTVLLDKAAKKRLHEYFFIERDTRFLSNFYRDLRFCYTLDDLIEVIHRDLESAADCSVLYVNMENHYVIYNSPSRITTDPETLRVLSRNFNTSYADDVYFIDSDLGLVSKTKNARGFFFVAGTLHFYVLCRYTHVFERDIFENIQSEFCSFQHRTAIISDLTAISELAKEWNMVAETQLSFLPSVLPTVKNVNMAAYFRPLVNVSGDYYHVMPMDENRTLFLLGDVSGKGLAAALVMGVVINTIKIIQDKNDLIQVVKSVDKAIKAMKLQDKYTVLFICVVDTKEMTIRYVNASMADPLIISKKAGSYEIEPLTSNCSLVGIIDIDDIRMDVKPLHKGDVILMASDGVSEVMDESGVELGDTELYTDTVKAGAKKNAQGLVDDISNLVLTYNGNKKLRDDVTMLVVKVED